MKITIGTLKKLIKEAHDDYEMKFRGLRETDILSKKTPDELWQICLDLENMFSNAERREFRRAKTKSTLINLIASKTPKAPGSGDGTVGGMYTGWESIEQYEKALADTIYAGSRGAGEQAEIQAARKKRGIGKYSAKR